MPSNRTWVPPEPWEVDLDAPPEVRWRHIVPHYMPWLKHLADYVAEVETKEYGSVLSVLLRTGVSWVSRLHIDEEFQRELKGIAEITAEVGLNYDKLLVLNLGYDLLARCSSAVVECPNGGGPVHLRNMDWDAEVFWPLTVDVKFRRAGQLVMTATTWVGLVGIQTGMREGGWSLGINYRQVDKPWAIIKNIFGFVQGAHPISFLMRRCLQDIGDFRSAVERLATAPLMAPSYLTVAGTARGQGVVLERSRAGTDRCQSLDPAFPRGVPQVEVTKGVCVITNLDCHRKSFDLTEGSEDMQWAEGGPLLMTSIERRQLALSLIDEWVKGSAGHLNLDGGFRVLGSAPVCNDQTTYSNVIRPSDGSYLSRVVLKWKDYSHGINAAAWDSWISAPAFEAIKAKLFLNEKRGDDWPDFDDKVVRVPPKVVKWGPCKRGGGTRRLALAFLVVAIGAAARFIQQSGGIALMDKRLALAFAAVVVGVARFLPSR